MELTIYLQTQKHNKYKKTHAMELTVFASFPEHRQRVSDQHRTHSQHELRIARRRVVRDVERWAG